MVALDSLWQSRGQAPGGEEVASSRSPVTAPVRSVSHWPVLGDRHSSTRMLVKEGEGRLQGWFLFSVMTAAAFPTVLTFQ